MPVPQLFLKKSKMLIGFFKVYLNHLEIKADSSGSGGDWEPVFLTSSQVIFWVKIMSPITQWQAPSFKWKIAFWIMCHFIFCSSFLKIFKEKVLRILKCFYQVKWYTTIFHYNFLLNGELPCFFKVKFPTNKGLILQRPRS